MIRKKCMFCFTEFTNEDVCPYCGPCYYAIGGGMATLMDPTRRVPNKNIANLNKTFGVYGGFFGFEEFVNVYGMKKPVLRFNWEEISSMTYPMSPVNLGWSHAKAPVGNGIELKMVNGKKLYLIVYGRRTDTETAKDLYGLMNRLHQNSIASYANQLGSSVSSSVQYTASQQVASAHLQAAQAAPSSTRITCCPSCGCEQEAGAKFCGMCGQLITPEPSRGKYCPLCGAKAVEGSLFCGECGSRLT